jgi:hypothetical protein
LDLDKMYHGIRLLRWLSLTWIIVVWPPIDQESIPFGYSQDPHTFTLSETEAAPGLSREKKQDPALPEGFKRTEPLLQDKQCDPNLPWWMTPHPPF